MTLKLDLHDVYNRGEDIDRALRVVIDEALEKRLGWPRSSSIREAVS